MSGTHAEDVVKHAAAGAPVVLEARDIHFAYPHQRVLRGVDLIVEPGEVVALLGANGAGKSTLLRILLGLVRPTEGEVLLNGRPLRTFARREMAAHMAYVPQANVCPFPYRVREVVAMGRIGHTGMFAQPGRSDREAVGNGMERLGIQHLAERPYTEISGGERQLTLLCRAVVQGASMLVMDEPASALDFGNQARLLSRLRALADEGMAVLMSTHHPDHALVAADRAILLRDGRVLGEGRPAEILSDDALQTVYGITGEELQAFTAHRKIGGRVATIE
ncbi:ABC transporter ATP-binding protein [Robbsia sp. Bb-Pol-6]|uniref:ABC transporter ATP-binding protein n=1 Tax=Robbsia betulipollinis TaxID=2981849 RepID=A0ABT3ZSM4_9BURK|nr:ABC transporter ATP-binding protein [Robbsia betulipollinis]MCY0389548.1 ABC transporter ATP-binding protein [Robbsia betulipollinis]